jgi:hypothetical protein
VIVSSKVHCDCTYCVQIPMTMAITMASSLSSSSSRGYYVTGDGDIVSDVAISPRAIIGEY